MPSANPKCSICEARITNPDFQYVWYQEGFEHIDIGPYCPDCFVKIKVCSGCQHPFLKDDVRHFGRGRHYCSGCAEDLDACFGCGNEESIHKVVDGKKYCAQCFSKNFIHCDCCEEVHPKRNNTFSELERATRKGLFKKYPNICRGCYSKVKSRFKKYSVRECKHCRSIYAKGSKGSDKYCDSCYSAFKRCTVCHEKKPSVQPRAMSGSSESNICDSCLKTNFKKCSSCKRYASEFDKVRGVKEDHVVCTSCTESGKGECKYCLKFTDLNPEGYCRKCHSTYSGNKCFCGVTKDPNGRCRVCDNTQIYNYSERPQLVFHNTEKDAKNRERVYFGFENEMTFSSSSKSEEHLKHLYKSYGPEVLMAKSDSSISGPGYEVVSQPMTLRVFHKMDLVPLFAGRNKEHSSCGLHVHVDRGAFDGSLHILKISKMIQEQDTFTNKIAGRSAGSYNRNFDQKLTKVAKGDKEGRAGEERGCRINLTRKDTIEFRLFLGADTEYKLRYRIEFLHALIEWTRNIGVSQVTPNNFMKYLKGYPKKYPNLSRFLNEG